MLGPRLTGTSLPGNVPQGPVGGYITRCQSRGGGGGWKAQASLRSLQLYWESDPTTHCPGNRGKLAVRPGEGSQQVRKEREPDLAQSYLGFTPPLLAVHTYRDCKMLAVPPFHCRSLGANGEAGTVMKVEHTPRIT